MKHDTRHLVESLSSQRRELRGHRRERRAAMRGLDARLAEMTRLAESARASTAELQRRAKEALLAKKMDELKQL